VSAAGWGYAVVVATLTVLAAYAYGVRRALTRTPNPFDVFTDDPGDQT